MCVSFAVELLQLEAARRVLCTETILQCGLCHPVPSCRLLHSTEPHAMKPTGRARHGGRYPATLGVGLGPSLLAARESLTAAKQVWGREVFRGISKHKTGAMGRLGSRLGPWHALAG